MINSLGIFDHLAPKMIIWLNPQERSRLYLGADDSPCGNDFLLEVSQNPTVKFPLNASL